MAKVSFASWRSSFPPSLFIHSLPKISNYHSFFPTFSFSLSSQLPPLWLCLSSRPLDRAFASRVSFAQGSGRILLCLDRTCVRACVCSKTSGSSSSGDDERAQYAAMSSSSSNFGGTFDGQKTAAAAAAAAATQLCVNLRGFFFHG